MPDGRCVLVCRECGGDPPAVLPFESWSERGRWAGAHTRGTGHDRWLCLDGWPPHDQVTELLRIGDGGAGMPERKHARVSGRGGRVHEILPKLRSGASAYPSSLCGQIPISGLSDPAEIGHWRWTSEPVDCRVCLRLAAAEGDAPQR